MIVDTYQWASTYRRLSANMETAFAWLDEFRFTDIADGRHIVDGDAVFALVQTKDTRGEDESEYEAHRRYIDLQYLASGSERMLIRPVGELTTTQPYSGERDIEFLMPGAGEHGGHATEIVLQPESYAIFFPQDAHVPLLHAGSPGVVRKLVLKIAL